MMYTPIVEAIQNEIERDNISTATMARRLELKQPTLYRILTEQRQIGSRVASQILKARPEWWTLLNSQEEKPC